MIKKLFVFAFLLQFSFLVQAQDSDTNFTSEPALDYIASDRPGQTYSAKSVGKGIWQLQMGVNWGQLINDNSRKFYNTFGFPIDLRVGLTENLELMLSPKPGFASTEGTGAGIEYSLASYGGALRYTLFRDKDFGSLAIFGAYQYVNYEGIAWGNNVEIKALYSLPLGKIITVSTNLGYSNSDFDLSPSSFDYTLNAFAAAFPKFGFFVEIFGSVMLEDMDGSSNRSAFDTGIYYLVHEDLQLDVGFATAEGLEFNQSYASVGLSYRFGSRK